MQPSESIETHVNNNSSINVIGDNLTHIINTNPGPNPNPNPLTVHNSIIPSSFGKQYQTKESPPKQPTTCSTCRKVITADARAMQEAQELMIRET